MVGAVKQRGLDVNHRIAGENAGLHGVFDTRVDRGNVLARDAATGDLVLKHVLFLGVGRKGFKGDNDTRELTGTTGLLLVRVLVLLDLLADGLAVGNHRVTHVGLDLELATHTVDDDVEVELTHTTDDGLAGLGVELDGERRVLFRELLDGDAHLLLVGLRLGLDGDLDNGGGEGHRLEDDRLVDSGKRVTRGRVLQADDRVDVASVRHVDGVLLVGVHLEDLADALLLALGRVEDLGTGLDLTGVHADEGELAVEGVRGDLEGQSGEGFLLVGLTNLGLFLGLRAGEEAANVADVERGGQEVHDGVEDGLHAHVTQGGTAVDGERARVDGQEANAFLDLLERQVAVLQVGFGEFVGALSSGFDERLAVLLGLLLVLLRNGAALDDGAERVVALVVLGRVGQGLHGQQVDVADEVVLGAHRDLHDDRGRVQAVADGAHREVEVGAHLVHLVDEADTRDVVLVGLTPHGLGLGLNALLAVEHGDSAVEDAQRALNLNGEVNVTGGVNNVDLVTVPERGNGGGRNRDAAFLFLFHPVGRRGAVVRLADLVVDARVEQDAFRHGRLAGIDVSHDANVADLVEIRQHL